MLKECKKCKRSFPMNTDYYFRKKDTKDGFAYRCKECMGNKFTNKLVNIPKDGYKFCIKCGKELPVNNAYFPIDNSCKDGFRNVCRECNPNYGEYKKEKYTPKKYWTEKDESLFIKVYPHYTNREIIDKFFPNVTLKRLTDKAFTLGKLNKTLETINRISKEKSENYSGKNSWQYGRHMPEKTKLKISKTKKEQYAKGIYISPLKGRVISEDERQRMSERKKGLWAGKNNPRHMKPLRGKMNGRWSGGIKQLYYDLRDNIKEWKELSMKNCNYRCMITGLEFDNIHHLYPFRDIVNEVFNELGYEQKQIMADYSNSETKNIHIKLNELHNKYGTGICLNKDIHKLFHDNFGYTGFTQSDFKKFIYNYYNGKYDICLKEELKSYESIKRLKEIN